MYQNSLFETSLIILFLLSLMLLFIRATAELTQIQNKSDASLSDEDPAFIDFFRP